MKLLNPELMTNGVPPPAPPPVIVKKGVAKCEECNIVFYKEESLIIHKKHYCSAREKSQSPQTVKEVAKTDSPPKESPKSLLQFICSACGIKFSSPDNLTAHQTYYCPKRDTSAEDKSVWRCPRCKIVVPEGQQPAHQCVAPAQTSQHGWKCPCCNVVSPTAASAQKHLESHAGIRAFRCTICGYRGNTLRGMRTHIRMHFEKRTSELQEENFISCILEQNDNRVDARDEESIAALDPQTKRILETTKLMLENSALASLFRADNDSTDISCCFCAYKGSSKADLFRHIAASHKLGSDSDAGSDENMPESPPHIKLEPEVKIEVQDEISGKTNGQNGGYCNTCDITFTMRDSYIAHKRLYCTQGSSRTPPETTVQ